MKYHDARVIAIKDIQTHPWLERVWKKLGESDVELVLRFTDAQKDLDFGSFEMAVNRMFLDQGDRKPKRWKEIQEILTCSNSAARAAWLRVTR